MSGVSINGVQTWGNLSQLKEGISLAEAQKKGQNDGLDQVYFSSNEKNFVLEGDGLDLSGINKSRPGTLPKIQFETQSKSIEAELRLENVDNEKSSVSDFAFSNPISITGAVIVGGTVISQIPRMLNNVANSIPFVGNGSLMTSPKAVGIAAAVGVGLIAAGAIASYSQRQVHSGVSELATPIQAAPEKSFLKKGIDFLNTFSPLP